MNLSELFVQLRKQIDEMSAFVSSADFSGCSQQERALYNEQLAAMERQSVAMSELINLSDGLGLMAIAPDNEE
ncbi:hypothetical protein LZ634_19710 [Kluyvera intermedia]|uniref:hypothetical protein n=1 Tax=Kluyvera intermedia TaxID=61648 RepID=UPI001F35231F|nr:hypothetical protein [Kluyvera intermedia]MCE9890909.1 hypothetical protein [Kluyvera intermedia]